MNKNLIENSTFCAEEGLPEGWRISSPAEYLMPVYGNENGFFIGGNGSRFCVGHLCKNITAAGGETYCFSFRFAVTDGFCAACNLIVSVYGQNYFEGIYKFERKGNELYGENILTVPGDGIVPLEIRVTYRYGEKERVYPKEICFKKTTPPAKRTARIAVITKGRDSITNWRKTTCFAAESTKPDLLLLPEMFNSCEDFETMDGESVSFLREIAAKYGIYTAGTVYIEDGDPKKRTNAGFLCDRSGGIGGRYDKAHPYSPEVLVQGVMPGIEFPIFETDFGKVAMMICYDSWFGDVAELYGLRGAELILFPNAGYDINIMPARCADNCVRIAVSSLGGPATLWDTAGRLAGSNKFDETVWQNSQPTYFDYETFTAPDGSLVAAATYDMNISPSPHNWGGAMMSAPGGRPCRRDQYMLLYDLIKKEII